MSTTVTVPGGPGIVYELNQSPRRRRLSLATRLASLVPLIFASFAWLVVAFPATVIAWFAIVITGQYPSGLFELNARAWRFLCQANAYGFLLVDARPSFSGNRNPGYPLQVDVTPLPEYNRLLTAFRGFAIIPLVLFTDLAMALAYVVWLPSLLMITLFGHQPESLQKILASALRLDARAISSAFLLTEIVWLPASQLLMSPARGLGAWGPPAPTSGPWPPRR